ncbi:MAG: hypothetical protein OXQ29_27720 [Rhodospirillaceae bacterium]|nr:hypothetical protein [Rhodospirillaceae bacterium]
MRTSPWICATFATLLVAGCGGGGDPSPPVSPPPPPPPPGVTVSPTNLTVMEGAEATYTIVLNSQPSGNVTVTPTSADTDAATVSGPVTFTTGDWNTAQTVTVTGVEENNADAADESVNIAHAVSGYGSVTTAADVQVTVSDDDVAANGIYGSYEDYLQARDNREVAGLMILHDGRLIGKTALAERNSTDYPIGPYQYAFTGAYVLDGDSLSADVRGDEFKEGPTADFLEMKTLSGTVVVQESLQLTLTDRDGEENRLSMQYADYYERSSSLTLWEGTWGITDRGISIATMTVDHNGAFFGQFASGCTLSGSLSVIKADRNLYALQFAMQTCDFHFWHGDYSGFAYLADVNGAESNEGVFIALRDDDFHWILTYARP